MGANSETPVTFETCIAGNWVKRGNNWKFGIQDHENGLPGTGVIVACNSTKWAKVKWNNGNEHNYRIGASDSFDLFHSSGIK